MTRIRNRLNARSGGYHIHGGYDPGTAGCIEFKDYTPRQRTLLEFEQEMIRYFDRAPLTTIDVMVIYAP